MDEPLVTVAGYVGGEVRQRQAGATPVTDFWVACTPATRDRAKDDWVSGTTQWYRVTAWRRLGTHCAASLRTGNAVVVHGRLSLRTWVDGSGAERTDSALEAVYVGHDLRRGTAVFSRPAPRPEEVRGDVDADHARDLEQSAPDPWPDGDPAPGLTEPPPRADREEVAA